MEILHCVQDDKLEYQHDKNIDENKTLTATW
jgi:hypothetical protein